MPRPEAATDTLTTIESAFDIIEWLDEVDSATATEVADEFDLPQSTAFTYLKTLVNSGYVSKNGNNYRPSLRSLGLGGRARRRSEVFPIAKPEMKGLAEKTGELVDLAVCEGGKRVLLYKCEGSEAISDDSPIGNHSHMHCSALGKAILAHLPPDEIESIIDRHGLPRRTAHTIADQDELLEELEEIRERGYTYNNEEWEVGLRAVAAPIKDSEGYPVGSVSITGPKHKFINEYYHQELPEKLLQTVNVIEIKLNNR